MTPTDDHTPHLSRQEREDIAENQGLSAVSVYGVVHQEGIDELARPVTSLWWSGVAAGLGITASVMAEGILHGIFADHPYRPAIENLGYTLGFVLVILGRLQLFTESTLTAILPLLTRRTPGMLLATARLWGIILAANFTGTFAAVALAVWAHSIPAEHVEGMLAISRHYAELTPLEGLTYGIPAGFYVAAIVWMLPSSRAGAPFVIMLFTYLIAMGDFTHVIAGSAELFLLLISGETGLGHAAALLVCTLIGNILGGTGLFALLAYGQVADEMRR
ncbi:formate/nitrite transporter family protein [Pseudooceanicola nanhaiensis]|uniref:formate/nitrite transporter family protein n=1 Tax=Pseudooceanicola nanhaiensis TaxID=375761 RepID=UPI001CD7885D|nr:formate/nitrite transporter family protein [Pseudooceanicola nanhaiensis]MCA0919316.1 formate/nitrite transporter family protein [Pseudooceanicola nanhaiensis]